MHTHFPSSMIIFIINIKDVFVLNFGCNSPVPADLDRPGSFASSLELMEIQTRQIHVFEIFRRFQKRENLPYPGCILGATPLEIPDSNKRLSPFVLELLNHVLFTYPDTYRVSRKVKTKYFIHFVPIERIE